MNVWLGHDFSAVIVLVDLIPQGAERDSEYPCGIGTAPTLIRQGFDNEFALDVRNRTPDKPPDGFNLVGGKLKRAHVNLSRT
jgi:hypothetical protein